MTDRSGKWTRRQFSQVLAATAASSLVAGRAFAGSTAPGSGFAFVGSSTNDPMQGTVRVYRVSGGQWSEVHAVSAASPAHLLMHPAMPVLYVVHDVHEWDNRPRGAVSAYRFDTAGTLAHLGTQPLSLSATNPRHAVVAAGGTALFVAAESGGIYNVLPIAGDGTLQPVSAIRKEFGLQDGAVAKTATPARVALGADGSVYSTDPGQETISRFAVSREAITLQHRSRVHAGAGPTELAVSASGYAYTSNAIDGGILVHRWNEEGSPEAAHGTGRASSMVMHPEARLLAASLEDALHLLRVHPRTGGLTVIRATQQPRLQHLQFTSGGAELAGMDPVSGDVLTYQVDAAAGMLGSRRSVIRVSGATSLLLHTA